MMKETGKCTRKKAGDLNSGRSFAVTETTADIRR